jgi:type III pantothenate kinase
MNVFCIDVGNTHTHFGQISGGAPGALGEIPTESLGDLGGPLAGAIRKFSVQCDRRAVAFCSVVPEASERLRGLFSQLSLPPPFQLTCDVRLGMTISYPRPEEIGQDRLANAVAATAFHPLPAIIIDMGTAVTFDIVTEAGGYEGGIIAPGLRIMTQYLHQQTALLPDIEEDFAVSGAIGKSTRDAMKIGCLIGFTGMIRSLLDAVTEELAGRGERPPTLLATGGTMHFLPASLRRKLIDAPAITLQGLAHAHALNHSPGL